MTALEKFLFSSPDEKMTWLSVVRRREENSSFHPDDRIRGLMMTMILDAESVFEGLFSFPVHHAIQRGLGESVSCSDRFAWGAAHLKAG